MQYVNFIFPLYWKNKKNDPIRTKIQGTERWGEVLKVTNQFEGPTKRKQVVSEEFTGVKRNEDIL